MIYQQIHTHGHVHEGDCTNNLHVHICKEHKNQHEHSLAYCIGLVHGLAGNGALIVVVMPQIKTPVDGLIYLVISDAGCIAV